MDLGLKGKVAMVSAASKGLGFAVANLLSREGAAVSISSSKQASVEHAAVKNSSTFRRFRSRQAGRSTFRRTDRRLDVCYRA